MKIAVTGKGGVGKTTIAATLARLYADEGHPVLAADVDPDANLGLALGFPEEVLDSIVPISKMRKLVEERTGASADNKFYKINPKVDDIPDSYSKVCNGVKLLVLGTVETAGSGCVCPEHVMLKRIINNLVLRREDVVILDMEAGLEHLGRGTTEGVDMFIVVIEPGARSTKMSSAWRKSWEFIRFMLWQTKSGMRLMRSLSESVFPRRICWAWCITTLKSWRRTGQGHLLMITVPQRPKRYEI